MTRKIYLYILLFFFVETLRQTNSTELYFYRKMYDFNITTLPLNDSAAIVNLPGYNSSLYNLIIAHGFGGSANGTCIKLLIEMALNSLTLNVFVANWSKQAATGSNNLTYALTYPRAAANSLTEGEKLGVALYNSSTTNRFDLKRTTLFGFSLGCPYMGSAGRTLKKLGESVARISGCDPAKPFYNEFPQLDATCADSVDIVNSDSQSGEYMSGEGHSTFWPNYPNTYTNVQPGCPERGLPFQSTPNSFCSHNCCVQLWAQSFSTCLEAGGATNYTEWVAGRITSTSCLGFKADPTAMGNYYLNTTDCPPYQPVPSNAVYPVATGTLTYYCQSFCPAPE